MMAPTPGPILGQVIGEPQDFMIGPRRSVTVSTKGLLNRPGQNNCFLNSAVQVLWHLDIFRRNFRALSGHACMAESCIFCALKELFTQFQYSQESALPPDALRHALAKTFCDQRRFQLGFMDDAAECFENILLRIHVHIANQECEDMCSNIDCIPHQKFAMTLVEQRICQSCGARSDPLPFTQMVHYITTSALCIKAMEKHEMDPATRNTVFFGNILRLAGDMGEVRECPGNCGSKVQVKKTLMNHPEVVSIGLVWDSESPTLQHITDVFHSIGMFLQLQDMFHYVYDMEWANNTTHQLVGVVTYYGKHYSTFFFHTKLKIWIYFDDAVVREIGPSWEQVVEKCQRGRFQPLLLLFANPQSFIDNDTPMQLMSNSNEAPFINQKQAVINQYLIFQNCIQNMNIKYDYNLGRNMQIYNSAQEQHLNSVYKSDDHGIPIYQNTTAFSYGQKSNVANKNQSPLYSNLQYLNALKHKEHSDIAKLNEVSLPVIAQTGKPNSYDCIIASDIYLDKKDTDAAKDSDSAFTEEDQEGNDMYISRKTVENVLNQQKRQIALCRSYSQSSIGNRNSSSSLESFDTIQSNKLSPHKSPLPENISNRRDSGSWSSDRNSYSSNNSVENPFLTVVASKRLLFGSSKKSQLSDYSNTNASSDHGYDSYSVSSSDSYPSINGSPVKLDPRLTQIPEDDDLDKKLKLVTEDSNGPPDCDKLCAEADLLLAKSHEKEKDGDLVMAALLCDSAAARARAAMEAPYNNSRSLVSAKMKHSTCVMRSANLYRRLKDHEIDERRKQKAHTGHHSRQSSRDSTLSKHSRQSSKDSTHSKAGSKENNHNLDDTENFGKNIEIYGTLPKKGGRKKNIGASGPLKVKDDQIYKDFLDKQRRNTSLAESLNETSLKNVDIHPQTQSNTKPKTHTSSDKAYRKSYSEGVPPKSPTRKKVETSPRNSESETRKKEQTSPDLPHQNILIPNKVNRDLLASITPPDKKQHKIKRKLIGGFMKRKNRSLPDLREDQNMSDKIDCFLDDAGIQGPSTLILPNGKAKTIEKKTDSGIGSITRGFHQPHHAFVKKDLTQRPLLMKVNPPNIQASILTSPNSKLIHSLPSISKKVQDSNAQLETVIPKSSKIPFISPLVKNEPSNLQPISPPPRLLETKFISRSNTLHKASAIPVLTPKVSLSPLKTVNIVKNDEFSDNDEPLPPPPPPICEETDDNDDIPKPSDSFLAEIQAKRKQLLNKSVQNKEKLETTKPNFVIQTNENKELSMLSKLACNARDSSWLKELQSKQQQLLNKQESKASFVNEFEKNKFINAASKPAEDEQINVADSQTAENENLQILPKMSEMNDKDVPIANVSNTTNTSCVKNLASKFEKVLRQDKLNKTTPANLQQFGQSAEPRTPPQNKSVENCIKMVTFEMTKRSPTTECIPIGNTNANSTLPKISALKPRIDYNEDASNILQNVSDNTSFSEMPIIKPILKQESDINPLDVVVSQIDIAVQRPTQPPDYATAMQRLELIRTSTNETNLLHEQAQISDKPKKKQGSKKTVTFSDEVILVACAEYDEIDFSSNPLFERVYQQHVESGKGEIAIFSSSYNCNTSRISTDEESFDYVPPPPNATTCNLCHNKQVSESNSYCTDCDFYLSRFKP